MTRCALGLLLLAACGSGDAADGFVRWSDAERAWQRRQVSAYALWQGLDPATPEGREARALLRAADAHYREGVEKLEAGEPGARQSLAAGAAIAPMNPEYYLRLARACRAQDIEMRAAEYYSKYLAAFPEGEESDRAREELQDLDPQLAGIFDPPEGSARALPPPDSDETGPWLAALGGVLVGLVLAATLSALGRWLRGRGISLRQLVERSPEFHPSVAYLVGSLRHELLKHRIGAAKDALAADSLDADQVEFLRGRLFGGQPLLQAWEGHLLGFERALGSRIDLRRDAWFRRAAKALASIADLESALAKGGPARARALRTLARAHEHLTAFDAHLAELVGGLVRASVDEGLLSEVVEAVRGEHTASRVDLDALEIVGPDDPIVLEVFRVDLVLVLKNVVRNAILAVGRDAPPRRVRVDVVVDLEPTGDETVRIRVFDSSAEEFDPSIIFDRRVDRGLGLVAAAVHRYGGAIDVERVEGEGAGEDALAGYRKAVVISFFRTDEDLARVSLAPPGAA